MLFIDESGSITKSKNPANRFFVIAIVETDEPMKVKREFRKAKSLYLKHNPDVNLDIRHEIKGSQMSTDMKKYIIYRLIQKTDISFNYIIVDNWNVYERLKCDVELTFNYVTWLGLRDMIIKNGSYDALQLRFDERNCAVRSINTLSNYLKTKFCIERHILKDLVSEYDDSKNYAVLQVADVLANLVFRCCKDFSFEKNDSRNIELLKSIECENMYFPYKYNNLSF